MTSWITADEVTEHLKPGMTVFVAGATSEPRTVLDALAQHGECCRGVRFVSVSIPGINRVDFTAFHSEAKSTAFFATPQNRDSVTAGRVDFIPLQYGGIYNYLKRELQIDAVIVQLPSPGGDGLISHGVSADFLSAVVDKAGIVIGEINRCQPAPRDAPTLPLSRLDFAVACERDVPTFPVDPVTDSAARIASHVAALIRDGDCLQLGIGSVPDAVLTAISGCNDLGVHSGMITDRVMELATAGNITGRQKAMDRGKLVTGTTLGSKTLIDWAGHAEQLAIRPVSYTHDQGVIRAIDNFVSINSAVQIDLFGQVNSETIGGRQISGVGGAVDMTRGAAMSRGGRSVIALSATAAGGKLSRIVTMLASDTPITIPRSDVDYVVTEYGARRLRNLSLGARAEGLIEIAAPEFRDQLRDDWRAVNSTS